ncbi:hypothetical protein [Brenneria tiliae]|uniref:hypothetical protein n=1 Tax=Brenneria tiliae TaxID=2914984 RepID=UPI002014D211|nr:hypothetical protein [Brenneria tiliae]MCL2897693.1 hypothetical protein [Brenneria tiliae]MCL2902290.1 hypothetical protein [Brenneria tiliae]
MGSWDYLYAKYQYVDSFLNVGGNTLVSEDDVKNVIWRSHIKHGCASFLNQ